MRVGRVDANKPTSNAGPDTYSSRRTRWASVGSYFDFKTIMDMHVGGVDA